MGRPSRNSKKMNRPQAGGYNASEVTLGFLAADDHQHDPTDEAYSAQHGR